MIVTTIWLGLIGFVDDYIKVFKKIKEGLSGKFKIVGQVGLGLIVGLTMYFSDDAHKKPEAFWNKYRPESLSARGELAYSIIDSLALEEGVDKKINSRLKRETSSNSAPTKSIFDGIR